MEILSYAISGENLAKDKTWLKGMEGKKIFAEQISIIDDGLFTRGPECFPFDSEAVTARKKILVLNGVMKEFIFDSYYANRMKRSSTGNSRRENFSIPPMVGPSNFYLMPGSKSQEQMIAGINSGLLVEEVLGMHTADEISGEFSIGVSGHWIKQGRIDQPVSGVAIAGTLKDLFSRVADVSDDLKFYHNCASPSILIEEMEISGG